MISVQVKTNRKMYSTEQSYSYGKIKYYRGENQSTKIWIIRQIDAGMVDYPHRKKVHDLRYQPYIIPKTMG